MSEALDKLRDPRVSLPALAKIVDQKTGDRVPYDPFALTDNFQATILSYIGDPPMTDEGQYRWFVGLGGRQAGKSLTAELGFLPKAAWTPGWDHVCMADIEARADYLHERLHFTMEHWPQEIVERGAAGRTERRQMTFDQKVGGKMRVLSAQRGPAGVGQSISSFHGSEVGLWPDAGSVWTFLQPALINRDYAYVVMECTPVPADAGSQEYWKTMCDEARMGIGRWLFGFFPFWDTKLCRRLWQPGWKFDAEEERLLAEYGPVGLCPENLAFRRRVMEMDADIRRNPDLFAVFYPFDPVSCWTNVVSGVISKKAVNAVKLRSVAMEGWGKDDWYREYKQPDPNAIYVIGADPKGYGTRDHGSFQVCEVWKDDLEQAACFSTSKVDATEFARELMKAGLKYNKALIVVGNQGVGLATAALLEEWGYPNLYYEEFGKVGKNEAPKNVQEMLGWFVDALIDEISLHDWETFNQIQSYKNDKRFEQGELVDMLNEGRPGRGRRPKHHWDRVSALIFCVVGARDLPRRARPKIASGKSGYSGNTWNDWMRWAEEERARRDQSGYHRLTYESPWRDRG